MRKRVTPCRSVLRCSPGETVTPVIRRTLSTIWRWISASRLHLDGEAGEIPEPRPAAAFGPLDQQHAAAAADEHGRFGNVFKLRPRLGTGDLVLQPALAGKTQPRDRANLAVRPAVAADCAAQFHEGLVEAAGAARGSTASATAQSSFWPADDAVCPS